MSLTKILYFPVIFLHSETVPNEASGSFITLRDASRGAHVSVRPIMENYGRSVWGRIERKTFFVARVFNALRRRGLCALDKPVRAVAAAPIRAAVPHFVDHGDRWLSTSDIPVDRG